MAQELLIEELTPNESHIISESSADGKSHFIEGTFMQGGIKNRNDRIYPVSEIANAVKEANARIAESCGIFGELDHPQTLTINSDRISHVITEMRMEGDNAIGRAKLLNTPMGQIAQELFNSGVKVGVSSRGAGTVTEGTVTDFGFITCDIVITPSAPGALPNSVFESFEKTKSGGKILSLAESIKGDPDAQKYLRKAIEKFLREDLFAKK